MTGDEYGIPLAKDPRRGAARPRQLKDTCDMCSASKVKCDKRKPLCTRCERLGYPCFYSPARRLPKRRSSQQAPSGGQGEPAGLTVLNESSHKRTASRSSKETSGSNSVSLHMDRLPGPAVSTAAIQGQSEGPQGVYSLAMEPILHHSPSRRSDRDMDFFGGSVDLMETFYHGCDFDPPTMTTANKSTMQAPLCTTQNGQRRHRSTSSASQQMESPTISESPDCATAAVSILQNISATNMPESLSHTHVINNETMNWVTGCLNDMVTAASIKRVSTMLICSCSKKADVGILVSAICTAVLDHMEAILGSKSHLSQNPSNQTDCNCAEDYRRKLGNVSAKKKTERRLPNSEQNPERCEFHRCSHQTEKKSNIDRKEMMIMMQLVDQLPRVSNVVAQFTQRYSQERDPITRGMMKALISSMNCKLQMITDGVTSWVAQN